MWGASINVTVFLFQIPLVDCWSCLDFEVTSFVLSRQQQTAENSSFSNVLYSRVYSLHQPVIKVVLVLSHSNILTICNPMDCSLPSSSVLGILQSRILEWVAISYSRRSSQSRNQIFISCICLLHWQIIESGLCAKHSIRPGVCYSEQISWKENRDIPRQHIKKYRHHFANKGPYSQNFGFSSSQVWMSELNHKEA